METKQTLDNAAKRLWQNISDFSLLVGNVASNLDITDPSFDFYYEVLKKCSDFARYIDKNFYND